MGGSGLCAVFYGKKEEGNVGLGWVSWAGRGVLLEMEWCGVECVLLVFSIQGRIISLPRRHGL